MAAEAQAVVLFASTQTAIRAERLFQARGIAGKLIPIPRQFGSDCGLAFRFAAGEIGRVQEALAQAKVEHRGVYVISNA